MNVKNVEYVDNCRNGSSDCFGCIGLRGKQFCILNKQYSQEAYEAIVPTIKKQMDETPYTNSQGQVFRYGEFFPIELSPFAYNHSVAQEYRPLADEQAGAAGYPWSSLGREVIRPDLTTIDLPDHIHDTDESYLERTVQCAHAKKESDGRVNVGCHDQCTLVYKFMPRELAMYKELDVALPRLCPNCRHAERASHLLPYQLWHRQCRCDLSTHQHGTGRCPNKFETSFAPDRAEIVYCEQCYQAEVV